MLTTEFDFWHKGQAVLHLVPTLEFDWWHRGQAVIMLGGALGAGVSPILYRPPVIVHD